MIKYLLLLVATYGSICLGEESTASAEDIQAISDAFGLDHLPEGTAKVVMKIDGTRTVSESPAGYKLMGEVWFEPYVVRESLCLAERHFQVGKVASGKYEWDGREYSRYYYWKDPRGECAGTTAANFLQYAVSTHQPIPTSDVALVITESDRLFQSAMDFAINELEWESNWPDDIDSLQKHIERFETYRNDGELKLTNLELSTFPVAGEGFAYKATYRNDSLLNGPTVTFSLIGRDFQIYGVGLWFY